MAFNLTNFTNFSNLADQCMQADHTYSAACLHKWFCPQIPLYFRNYGIGLIIAQFVIITLLYAMRKWGSMLDGHDLRWEWGIFCIYFPFDFKKPETIAYWTGFLNELYITACVFYILILVSWTFA